MEAPLLQDSELVIVKQSSVDNQILNSNHLIYRTFATKAIDTFLGISVQKERLYVVQKKSICLFEYFVGYEKAPVLIKEILLPFEISKYIITQKYICIKSKNKTQIRDNEFEKVFYSQNNGILITRPRNEQQQTYNSNDFTFDTVEELELDCEIMNDEMISWKVVMKRKIMSADPRYLREYWSERYDILTKHKSLIKCRAEMIDPLNKNRKVEICKSPVFVNQLGYIQNFYIWPISANDIQIGMFYNYKEQQNVTENLLYEICSFQLRETNIKNIFHYNFKNFNSSRTKDGPHLFLAVCENNQTAQQKDKSLIKIVIFEILPEQNLAPNESLNEALNNCLDQFNQLSKQKKSQQSLSSSTLLNELLSNEGKSSVGSNPSQPTIIIESFILKNSATMKKIFYNPLTNVLWINDASELVYKIKFIESGDLKNIRENNLSFIQNLEGFKNGQSRPDLEGIMYDNFPIFKVNAYNLEIGTRITKEPAQIYEGERNESLPVDARQCKQDSDEKEVIQFDDRELEKIDQEKFQNQLEQKNITLSDPKLRSQKICNQVEIQIDHRNSKTEGLEKPRLQMISQSTQTENHEKPLKQVEQKQEAHIQINNLSELLKQLNFNKVEDVLMRFSQLFSGLVTKNVNKLKDFNQKAKEEIKLKINGDIFDQIKEVFSSLMGDALSQKIEKEVAKAREFVEKIFNKHMEHFNLMLIDERTKEENIKKCILEEQLRSIETIKQASFKFLDVTKIREMQKIAYNEVVVESIKEVGKKIQTLQNRLAELTKESLEMEKKIISQVKEIKQTFKLLIQLEEDESGNDENEDGDEIKSEESGFESEQEEEDEEIHVKDMKMGKQGVEEKRVPMKHGTDFAHHYPFINPHQMQSFNERAFGWNQFYQANHPYQTHPSQYPPQYPPSYYPPPQQFYPPPLMYQQPLPQSYSIQSTPYSSSIQSHPSSYFPSPQSFINPQYSQIRKGPQIEDNEKREIKKRVKSSGKTSSMIKND